MTERRDIRPPFYCLWNLLSFQMGSHCLLGHKFGSFRYWSTL